MNERIAVTILCTAYNHERYIRDALEGFVMQKTSFPFEVLVHDDASTDKTADIIREYEEKYPDIIKPIYQTENQHSKKIPITRTFLLPRAQGKYIALCEGDDYWIDPMKLQKQYDFMEANPEYSMCACSTQWYNMKTGIIESRGKVEKDVDITLEEMIAGKKRRYFQYASIFIKADVYVQFPNWRTRFPIGDYPLTVLAALNGKVRMLADVMSVYRYYSENSWTVRMDNDESRARVSVRMIEGLEALDAETDGAHHDLIAQRIRSHKYTLALMNHDYKTLRSEELNDIFKSRSLMMRTSDVIRCKYPKLYAKAFKPLARLIKSKYGE